MPSDVEEAEHVLNNLLQKRQALAARHDSESRSLDAAIAEGTVRVERARQSEGEGK
jgi:hypothetical protein